MCSLATVQQWRDYGIEGKVNVGNPILAFPWERKLQVKINKAISVIQDLHIKTNGKWYVSASFGVDSLVVYHIAKQVISNPLAMWVNQGKLAEWPDCLALKDLMVSQGMNLKELMPDTTLYDWYKINGIPLASGMTSADDKRLNEALMYAPIRRFNQQENMQGHAWGLRSKGENRKRGILISKRGELYQREDLFWVASPVARWTKKEIFAYIDLHEIPYPAMYDRNREDIRNGPPIGTSAINLGRIAKLKQYFPEIYRVFVSEFPEIARFS